MCDSSAIRQWACSNLASLTFKESETKRCVVKLSSALNVAPILWHLLDRRFEVPNNCAIWVVQRTTQMLEITEETAACDKISWPLPLCVEDALLHHGTLARLASTARCTARSPTHLTAHKTEQMVIKSFPVMAAGASSSPGRLRSCPGTPAPAVAHRATSSFRRPVARRRRPLYHCRRPGRCRRAMRRIQHPQWRPHREAPLRHFQCPDVLTSRQYRVTRKLRKVVQKREKAPQFQPFSQEPCNSTIATEVLIGLCGVVEADLELFCNCLSAGILGKRL